MARRVFFHIGAPKTGTTFLQAVLWNNREMLREQGVLFAGDHFTDRVYASNVVRASRQPRSPREASSWDRIVAQVNGFEGDAIISHEFFGAATEEQAQQAMARLAPADIHVVFTARDYVRQIPALWQEQLKFRLATPLAEYEPAPLDAGPRRHFGWRSLDAADALRRWGAGLPPSRVHVVTVPPPGSAPDLLWQRFATLCGIDPDSCDPGVGRANESLGVVEAELLRRTNPRLSDELRGPREVPHWVRDFLGHKILVPRGGPRFGLGPDRVEELRKRSLDTVDELRAAGYDVVGDLEELIPPDDAPTLRLPEDVTDSELLDAALDTIATLVSEVRSAVRDGQETDRRAEATEKRAREAERRLGKAQRRIEKARQRRERLRAAQPAPPPTASRPAGLVERVRARARALRSSP